MSYNPLCLQDRGAHAGYLVTLITLTGMAGIMAISIALDRTKWFK